MIIKINKRGEHFNIALAVIFLSVAVSLFAFMSEEKNNVTGFVAQEPASDYSYADSPVLREFNNFSELGSLAKGNYYIDNGGIVYWIDDESKPAVAKVNNIQDVQKSRIIYIDENGSIGYLLR